MGWFNNNDNKDTIMILIDITEKEGNRQKKKKRWVESEGNSKEEERIQLREAGRREEKELPA